MEESLSQNSILKVNSLSVEIEGEKIIENLSFEVKKGEILTILGPNGAGKTVLLRTLLGFLPYKGEILWQKNLRFGYLPQGLTQLEMKHLPLTVEDFFKLKKGYKPFLSERTEIKDKSFLKKRLGDLSAGQFQRTLINWVLFGEPDVLLFDEPESQLDIGGEGTVHSFLRRLWEEKNLKSKTENGLTILLVTHDLDVVYKYSTSVLCLNKNKICQGSAREILTPEILEKTYNQEIKFYHHTHQ